MSGDLLAHDGHDAIGVAQQVFDCSVVVFIDASPEPLDLRAFSAAAAACSRTIDSRIWSARPRKLRDARDAPICSSNQPLKVSAPALPPKNPSPSPLRSSDTSIVAKSDSISRATVSGVPSSEPAATRETRPASCRSCPQCDRSLETETVHQILRRSAMSS